MAFFYLLALDGVFLFFGALGLETTTFSRRSKTAGKYSLTSKEKICYMAMV